VGSVDYSVTNSIDKAGLSRFVNRISYVPHNEVVNIQQQSQVLLLLINDTPNAKVILPGKFFEYMAALRPVLCIGPADGDAAQVIAETNAGFVAGINDEAAIRSAIRELYQRFITGNNSVDSQGVEKYSRKQLTGEMAARLTELVNRGQK
jgi:glycosyltransferase involved in cell wall biosynthesis